MKFEYFKITNDKGLFSTGGMSPRWTKNGKTWHAQGHMTNHLVQMVPWTQYLGCNIVKITPEGVEEFPVEPFLLEKMNNYYNNVLGTYTSEYWVKSQTAYKAEIEKLENYIKEQNEKNP